MKKKVNEVILEKHVTVGLTSDGKFVWSAKNVANLFEVIGYLDFAREEVKKKIREIPKT